MTKFDALYNKLLEAVDTKHQVGGEHWGEMKDDEGNSHYIYVKDVIDAANKKQGKPTVIGGVTVRTK